MGESVCVRCRHRAHDGAPGLCGSGDTPSGYGCRCKNQPEVVDASGPVTIWRNKTVGWLPCKCEDGDEAWKALPASEFVAHQRQAEELERERDDLIVGRLDLRAAAERLTRERDDARAERDLARAALLAAEAAAAGR